MAYPVGRAAVGGREGPIGTGVGGRPPATRHPLVAAAIVLPCAVLLAVLFGGWEAVVTQASSVAGLLER